MDSFGYRDSSELTFEERNQEMLRKLSLPDPNSAWVRERYEREALTARALELDRVSALLTGDLLKAAEASEAPEAIRLARQAIGDFRERLAPIMQAKGLDGAEAHVVAFEESLPALKAQITELAQAHRQKVAERRERLAQAEWAAEAASLDAHSALALLEGTGMRLRVKDGRVQVAGPNRVAEGRFKAILESHRDGMTELLKEREQWRDV